MLNEQYIMSTKCMHKISFDYSFKTRFEWYV